MVSICEHLATETLVAAISGQLPAKSTVLCDSCVDKLAGGEEIEVYAIGEDEASG